MDKSATNFNIRTAGCAGLIAVALSFSAATVRFPATKFNVFNAITPLIGVELVHNKSELSAILGPEGSENRRIIAHRSDRLDFVPAFLFFMFALNRLHVMLRPGLYRWVAVGTFSLIFTYLAHYEVVSHAAEAANASVITDEMIQTLRVLVILKWNLFFADIFFCTVLLRPTRSVLRFGGNLLFYSAYAGMFLMAGYDQLIPLLIMVMFVAFSGVAVLLLVKPEILYELPDAGLPSSTLSLDSPAK